MVNCCCWCWCWWWWWWWQSNFPERGCPAAALRVWPWASNERTPIGNRHRCNIINIIILTKIRVFLDVLTTQLRRSAKEAACWQIWHYLFFRDVRRHPGQLPTDSFRNQRHEDVVSVLSIDFDWSGTCRLNMLLVIENCAIKSLSGSIWQTKLLGQKASRQSGQKSRWTLLPLKSSELFCHRIRPPAEMLLMNPIF